MTSVDRRGVRGGALGFERHLLLATVLGPALSFAAAPLLAEALGRDGRGTVAAAVSGDEARMRQCIFAHFERHLMPSQPSRELLSAG